MGTSPVKVRWKSCDQETGNQYCNTLSKTCDRLMLYFLICFTDGSLRLVDGNYPYEGRVEVFYHGQWGTICDDLWDIQDATVVCQQLGFPAAESAFSATDRFSIGTGEIFLDDLQCSGDESRLIDCQHPGWRTQNCGHSEDAAVVCSTSTLAPGVTQFAGVRSSFV